MAQSGKKEANMVTLFFANVLYWVCAGVYSPFLSAHYTGLGLSAAETGILLAATPVCALAIQPLWSTIADKLGRPARSSWSCAWARQSSLLCTTSPRRSSRSFS